MRINSRSVEKFVFKVADKVKAPQQRFMLGVTALATQPFIDLSNKEVDEDTRVLSACRTVAKIIAGTVSGVLVRSGCIKVVEKLSEPGGLLDPMRFAKDASKITAGMKKAFPSVIGTIVASLVMVGTNFLFDAPVTKKLTDVFHKAVTKGDKNETKSPK